MKLIRIKIQKRDYKKGGDGGLWDRRTWGAVRYNEFEDCENIWDEEFG